MEDLHCIFELGSMHHRGLTGSKRNKEKAARYFRRGAEKGHARSQFQLGLCYHDCDGVVQSFEQARYWWEKAKVLIEAAARLRQLTNDGH